MHHRLTDGQTGHAQKQYASNRKMHKPCYYL